MTTIALHEDVASPRRPRVERELRAIARAVTGTLGTNLEALVLVGGYARGEGGALGDGPEAPSFNDYDLVAIVRRIDAATWRVIGAIAHAFTEELGVEVDLWPITRETIEPPPPTLFWLDVALGGAVVLVGDPAILDTVRSLTPRSVPLEEAARLLANRATGLALSRLEGPNGDVMRTAKHVHKAILSCGDARLLAAAAYAPTLRERALTLERLDAGGLVPKGLAAAYGEAVAFRMRPDLFMPRGNVARWFEDACRTIGGYHLTFESFRLGEQLSATDYVRRTSPIFPRRPDGLPIAFPAAARAALTKKSALFPYVGHPRERLARASVALAYIEGDEGLALAAHLLGVPTASPPNAALRETLLRLRDVGS